MSKSGTHKRYAGNPDILKHLKIGDIFDARPNKNAPQNFTVLRADIVHKTHPDIAGTDETYTPTALIFTSNYPFGRRNGDTPLRYVVYAELAPQ